MFQHKNRQTGDEEQQRKFTKVKIYRWVIGGRGQVPSQTQNNQTRWRSDKDTRINETRSARPRCGPPLPEGLPVEEGSVSSEGWESWGAEAACRPSLSVSGSRCVLTTTGWASRGSKGCKSWRTRRFLAKRWLWFFLLLFFFFWLRNENV